MHWANLLLHWANLLLHWANLLLHWANLLLHWANLLLHWANLLCICIPGDDSLAQILWEEERVLRGLHHRQSFVDLGCGNGLLVYLLTCEGVS